MRNAVIQRAIVLTASTARNDLSLYFGTNLGARDENYAHRALCGKTNWPRPQG